VNRSRGRIFLSFFGRFVKSWSKFDHTRDLWPVFVLDSCQEVSAVRSEKQDLVGPSVESIGLGLAVLLRLAVEVVVI
jgi:hypothetical protein